MTDDPTDLDVLTPGHFLIGDALLAPADESEHGKNERLLNRWQLIQRFWNKATIKTQNG